MGPEELTWSDSWWLSLSGRFGEVQKQGKHLRKKSAGPGDLGSIGKAAVEEEGLILVMLHIKTFRT